MSTIAATIFRSSRLGRGLPAFVEPSGTQVSYDDALAMVDQLVEVLSASGLHARDRVAFMSPRGPLGVLGFVGVASVAICCPLNPRLREDEIAACFETLGISAVLTADSVGVEATIAQQKRLPLLVLRRDGNRLACEVSNGRTPETAGKSDSNALLMQTSGTTSTPKLVLLTHHNILSAAGAIRDAFGLGEGDHCLNPMPLHHVHGLISAGLSSLVSGSRVTCTDAFSVRSFEALLTDQRPTWFTASPAMHLALLEHFKAEGRTPGKGRLRFFRSSSAPLPASSVGALEELFAAPLIETYGLTETASMICSNPLPPAQRKIGSVGNAFGAEIAIADSEGKHLPAGQHGEIIVRGPSVIEAYAGGAQRREDTYFGTWLRSGDLGYLDADGYLFIVGRTKELIKRGGLSVYPAEIDDRLNSHPDVAEAVAFSLPHPTLGEELVAAVVPRANATVSPTELKAFLARGLSSYKVPTEIVLVASIPKNETGKILRREMPSKLAGFFAPRSVAPEGTVEPMLLRAWQDVLSRADIGVTDNVFVFGADPLRAERVSQILRERNGIALSARTLLSLPTVREQAAHSEG